MRVASSSDVPRPGMLATVRNRRGIVAAVEPYDGDSGRLHLVHLEYKDDQLPAEERLLWELEPHCTLLEPTALPEISTAGPMPPEDYDALVRAARWTALAPYIDPDGAGPLDRQPVASPFHGAVQVEDYQLVPLLKALRMPRVNLLIADDVGLGKTVEAGLILTELLLRRRIQRVLVLTPASLRLQWCEELWEKFSLRFDLVDRRATDRLKRQLGMDANPWRSFGRIVASYHYLRQPDVLEQFLAACRTPAGSPHLPWDLLIVDECHNLMPSPFGEDSDLCRMLRLIAPHFEHRLFLSATPHNGHTRSFTGLLEILDPVRFSQTSEMTPAQRSRVRDVVVRRLKREINERTDPPRFCRRLPPRALPLTFSPSEAALTEAFGRFRSAVHRTFGAEPGRKRRTGHFAVEILGKRLLSCPTAFAESWRRLKDGLASLAPVDEAEVTAAERSVRQDTGDDREAERREEVAATVIGAWLQPVAGKLAGEIGAIDRALAVLGFDLDGPLIAEQDPSADARFEALVALVDELLGDGAGFCDDERLVVFTEYKTTLDYLARRLRALHGDERVLVLFGGSGSDGMGEADRERVKAAFNDPANPVRILVATDAAAEGLNLHRTARYLLHYDCPWNPSRLEQAHTLLRPGGRLGFVVPSGVYSDQGTGPLRRLFLERCRWEWLFGFENREKIFDIDSRYKFNPVVVEKGGRTGAIRTAFMRRDLDDWERAESLAIPYTREQVERFSPKSLAILEIQSRRDLEILEKIYANSVLLGDQGPGGWGIKYATEFHMTNDSSLFPPRPWWEERGYRPDEYSRWIKGPWRPIAELWSELGVDPSRPRPAEIDLEDWLFDTTAGPDRREREARFAHGHLLKPGDVARTPRRLRCAQPPYDTLPLPRAEIPEGIILSREADAWIHEEDIEDVALPLYEGRMIGQFDFSQKGWVSGRGRGAVWREIPWERKVIDPQFLMAFSKARDEGVGSAPRVVFMDIVSSTNERTFYGTVLRRDPCGHSAPTLAVMGSPVRDCLALCSALNSFCCDWLLRHRVGGLHLTLNYLEETPLPKRHHAGGIRALAQVGARLILTGVIFADLVVAVYSPGDSTTDGFRGALSTSERLRDHVLLGAVTAGLYGIDSADLLRILDGTLFSPEKLRENINVLNPKGFWRVDKDKPPELRHRVLTLVAFHDLEEKIRAAGGDREKGIEAFLAQNDGEGWMLPETLRLADYGLGHDDRARHPQPVASRLGPRFYDWQLTQTPEESWQECHLHARNLLGHDGYQKLLDEIEGTPNQEVTDRAAEPTSRYNANDPQGRLFE